MAKKRKKKKLVTENSLVNAENLMMVQPPKRKEEDTAALAMTDALMKIKLERELRRYVKRSGGLRKGLENHKETKARVEKLMKALGRTKMVWDQEINVPGYDDPSVRDLTGVI